MYIRSPSSRVTACVFLSSLDILLEKREGGREGGRTKERERETLSPNCEQEIVQRPDDTLLSPPKKCISPFVLPFIYPSIYPSSDTRTRTRNKNDRLHKRETKGSLSLSPSLPLSIRISFHRSKQPKLFSGGRCWICSWRFEKKKKEFCQVLPGWFLSLEVI